MGCARCSTARSTRFSVGEPAYDHVVSPGAANKASPGSIIRAHRQTYISAPTGRRRLRDNVQFEIVPLLAVGVSAYFRLQLPTAASGALIAVAAFLSAFLFTTMVSLWSRAADLPDGGQEATAEFTRRIQDLEDLAANSAYAALVCIAAAVVFVVASFGHGWVRIVSTAAGLALGLHLFLILLMVMKRVFTQTQASLLRAKTGGGTQDRPSSRRAAPPAA
jgi:hypothetical protein